MANGRESQKNGLLKYLDTNNEKFAKEFLRLHRKGKVDDEVYIELARRSERPEDFWNFAKYVKKASRIKVLKMSLERAVLYEDKRWIKSQAFKDKIVVISAFVQLYNENRFDIIDIMLPYVQNKDLRTVMNSEILRKNKEYSEVLKVAEKLIERWDDLDETLKPWFANVMAYTYMEMGDWGKARRWFLWALQTSEHPSPYFMKQRFRAMTGVAFMIGRNPKEENVGYIDNLGRKITNLYKKMEANNLLNNDRIQRYQKAMEALERARRDLNP
ncbi:MAG: hypothetical protein ACTSVF_05865 [Candidatus Asgardarchaeia archaeon]